MAHIRRPAPRFQGEHGHMQRWARRLVGGGVLLVLAGAGLWASGAGSASGAGNAMISLSPASQNVAMGGDVFKIDVRVSNVENLGGFDITMTFNKDVLEYLGIAKGPFLSSTGRAAACIAPYPGPNNSLTPVENVNQNGAFHFGCNTRGESAAAPAGDGVLMTVGFKAKAPGTADLAFQGLLAGSPYVVRAPQGDSGENGSTGLAIPEGAEIPADTQGGVVQVYDPNAPAPTAVPATPTVAAAPAQRNIQATVQAVLGKPERRLDDGTPIVGAFISNSGSGDGTSGSTGASGAADSVGGVAGASSGDSSAGRTGNITTQGSSTGSSAGGSRSASGAPHAGFGPDAPPGNPWAGRASLALVLAGAAAVMTGAVSKRRTSE